MAANLLSPSDLAIRKLRDAQRGIRVLSEFDGMSGMQEALRQMGIPVDVYAAAEIDEPTIKITQNRFPNTMQLGGVEHGTGRIGGRSLEEVVDMMGGPPDLVCGGSPCQDLSRAGAGKGLTGERSRLFYDLAQHMDDIDEMRARQGLPPAARLVENVIPKDMENARIMSERLGIEPLRLNASDWGPQYRDRLYWTNLPTDELTPPGGISASEWASRNLDEDTFVPLTESMKAFMHRPDASGRTPYERWATRVGEGDDKFRAFVAQYHKRLPTNVHDLSRVTGIPDDLRSLTERAGLELSGFPRDYFEGLQTGRGLPKSTLWHAIGNGWNLGPIRSILERLPEVAMQGLKTASRAV